MYYFLRFLFRNILIDKILEKISCMSILLLETILMTKQTVCESYFSVHFSHVLYMNEGLSVCLV